MKSVEVMARSLCGAFDSEINPNAELFGGGVLWKTYIGWAEELIAVLHAAGLRIVPAEPTEAMLEDGLEVLDVFADGVSLAAAYRAMLAAYEAEEAGQ